MLSFCFALVVMFVLSDCAWDHKVVVSPNGTDNSTCLEKNFTCSLHFALNYEARNSTEIAVLPGTYRLGNVSTFVYLKHFALLGADVEGRVEIICQENAGFTFEYCEDILIQGITLRGCGSLHHSTTGSAFGQRAHIKFISAIFVVYTKNLTVRDSHILQTPGIGINLYDVSGVVRIEQSSFEKNMPNMNSSHAKEPGDVALAGGGVYLELTTFGGLPPFKPIPTKAKYDSNNLYVFDGCTFLNNSAPDQKFSTMLEFPHGEDHIPFGRGGGLSIFIRGNAGNNTIQISNCSFIGNTAVWGAGFFLEFQDRTENNSLTVSGSTFRKNRVRTAAGGAIRTGTITDDGDSSLHENKIIFEDCIFENNAAVMGGGVSHYGTRYLPKSDQDLRQVEFKRCHWANNTATMGSAISLATSSVFSGLQGVNPKIPYAFSMENCSVMSNKIILTEDHFVIGQGAVYTYALPLILRGNTTFENNSDTAVVLDNALLRIYGSVLFKGNTGSQGGALAIYGQSKLMLMPNSKLEFIENHADEKGGAIFVQGSGPPVVAFETTELNTHGCFIGYNDSLSLENVTEWQTTVLFQDNTASEGGGNSIYATTLQGCRKMGESRQNNTAMEWPKVMEYKSKSKTDIKLEISTDAIKIRFTEEDWNVAPSELFNASIGLIDEKNSSVRGVVKLFIPDSDVSLVAPSPLLLVQDIHHDGKIHNLKLKGPQSGKFKLQFKTMGSQVVYASFNRTLLLKECNSGFHQKDGNYCECLPTNEADGIAMCGDDGKSVYLKPGYWGGKVGGTFTTFPCPPNYCNSTSVKGMFLYNESEICRGNRSSSSILCGECKRNYSVNLGNEACSLQCNNAHLWFLLLFFVVTLVLVLVILRIDLDIFTTYLNAWLYSYQVIGSLLQEGQKLDLFLSFIIGLANWQVEGVSSCLYKGMNNLQKLGINYILPAYVLILLVVLAKIGRLRPACYINRNVYRAFCTLLVLCYTNVTTISFKIIHWVPLGKRWVLFVDGSVDFYKNWQEHLPFTILAVVWIIFFVIPIPLILLFTPWFLKRFSFLKNFRLHFDNFERCFKTKYRWFAAFYFLCRIYILFLALYVPIGPLKRSLLEVSCVLITAICLYIQPYNERYSWLNTLDAVLLTNLSFITIFSSGRNSEASDRVQNGLWYTVNVLAYIPLLYSVALLCYSGWNYFCPSDPGAYKYPTTDEDESSLVETSTTRPLDVNN